jgi:hypothetical protein
LAKRKQKKWELKTQEASQARVLARKKDEIGRGTKEAGVHTRFQNMWMRHFCCRKAGSVVVKGQKIVQRTQKNAKKLSDMLGKEGGRIGEKMIYVMDLSAGRIARVKVLHRERSKPNVALMTRPE